MTYFDCARSYWGGRAEEAYGLGLRGVRNDVFLTTKSHARTAQGAAQDLETSLRLLQTDHVDLWQVHAVESQEDIERILGPGGALEAFDAAKRAGKCRFIGFTGHADPAAHAALLRAYDGWDTVLMPLHAADHAYLSFEQGALPVAVERGVGVQAMKVFGKGFLLRSLHPAECLRYALSLPGVHVAVCGAGTQGQMEDNIRAVRDLTRMTPDELAAVADARRLRRRRAHRPHAGVLEEARDRLTAGTVTGSEARPWTSSTRPGPAPNAVCSAAGPAGARRLPLHGITGRRIAQGRLGCCSNFPGPPPAR